MSSGPINVNELFKSLPSAAEMTKRKALFCNADGELGTVPGNNVAPYIMAYRTVAKSNWFYKVKIKATTNSAMLYFKLRLYGGYNYFDIDVSGYNYITDKKWYMPRARLVSSSVSSINFYFGYDGPNEIWVAVPGFSYGCIAVVDPVYSNTSLDLHNLFEIVVEEGELTGNIQSELTLNRLAGLDDLEALKSRIAALEAKLS